MKIGLISDTHGLMRPEAIAALRGSDLILHAGDVGSPYVLEALRAVAPLVAVRGNNDRGPWADALPESETVTAGSVRIHLLHDLGDLDAAIETTPDVIVSGHSHRPRFESRGGTLYANPGSAGPRRFRLPVTVGRLTICGRAVAHELVDLLSGND